MPHAPLQSVLPREFARKFVVAPRRKHEFHFIVFCQLSQIPRIEGVRLARIGALYVHNLYDFLPQSPDESFPARLDHHRVARRKQPFRQRINLLLQQRLAACQFHQWHCRGFVDSACCLPRPCQGGRPLRRVASSPLQRTHLSPRQLFHARYHFLDGHLLPTVEGICRVAPCASQIAACQPHKNTRQTGACAFALDRFEDFRDYHDWNYDCANAPRITLRLLRSVRSFWAIARKRPREKPRRPK